MNMKPLERAVSRFWLVCALSGASVFAENAQEPKPKENDPHAGHQMTAKKDAPAHDHSQMSGPIMQG